MNDSLKAKLISAAKGLAIAAGGAALTYLSGYLASADFGYGPGVAAVLAALVNSAKLALEHYRETSPPATPGGDA